MRIIKVIIVLVILLAFFQLVYAISDPNLNNNNMTTTTDILDTKNLDLTFIPIDTPNDYNTIVQDSMNFINATYPISDDGIIYHLESAYHTGAYEQTHYTYLLFRISLFTKISKNIDRTVGVLPAGWFNSDTAGISHSIAGFGSIIPSVLIESIGYNQIAAHELGHSIAGFCEEYDANNWTSQDGSIFQCPNGDDPDLAERQLDQDCIPLGCPVNTLGIVVPWSSSENETQLYNFMGNGNPDEAWISEESYNYLLSKFKTNSSTSDQTLLISGVINKSDDSIKLFPEYELDTRYVIQSNDTSEGNYSVDTFDSNNNTIFHMNFTPSFLELNFNGSITETNISYFIFIINNTINNSRIEVKSEGVLKDSIGRTPSVPIINITYPIGGETFPDPFNLTWNATDADNDTLYYAILVSEDNGSNYTTLDIDYNQTYYEIDPGDFDYSEQYLFKVLVTDDVNTNYDYSNTFTMGKLPPNITSISTTPNPQGFGENITIEANITKGEGDIDTVLAGITPPGGDETTYLMWNISSNIWILDNFTDFTNGTYSYTVYVNDSNGKTDTSSGTFDMYVDLYSNIRTLKDNYTDGELVNITDPPETAEPLNNPTNMFIAKDNVWAILKKDYISKYLDYKFVYVNDTHYRLDWKWDNEDVKKDFMNCADTVPSFQTKCAKELHTKYFDEYNFGTLRSDLSYMKNHPMPKSIIKGNANLIGDITPFEQEQGSIYINLEDGFYKSNGLRIKLGFDTTLIEFNNSKTTENLTFTRAGNITRYLKIKVNSTISSAAIDLRGYEFVTQGLVYSVNNTSQANGMATKSGDYFWIANAGTDYVYKFNKSNSIVDSWDISSYTGFIGDGIEWDGTYFWANVDGSPEEVYKFTDAWVKSSGFIIDVESDNPSGIAYYNNYVYVADRRDNDIYKYNTSGNLEETIPLNSITDISGIIKFEADSFWGVSYADEYLVKLNNSGHTIKYFDISIYEDYDDSYDMSYDGTDMWVLDTNRPYTVWQVLIDYPINISIDSGNDSSYDYTNNSKFNGSINNLDLNITAIQNYLDSCTPDAEDYCYIPIVFYSDTFGKLEYSDINVRYEELGENESKIRNDAVTNTSVYLLMKVQYWNGSDWLDESIIQNDTLLRKIQPGENNQLKLDAIWNPNAWNTSTKNHPFGTYRAYVAATDENDITLINNDGTQILATYNFSLLGDNPPAVTLVSPANNYSSATGTLTFNCSATEDGQLVNITLYHNISGSWTANQTKTITGTSNSTTFTLNNIPNGNYKWNCLAYDNASQQGWGNINHSVDIALAPTINSISATPAIQGFGENVTITANITDLDDNIDAVFVEIISPEESETYTMNNISEDIWQYKYIDFTNGTYTYTVYANDSTGLISSDSGTFEMYINLYINIWTLKDNYSSNELVNITDPPELIEESATEEHVQEEIPPVEESPVAEEITVNELVVPVEDISSEPLAEEVSIEEIIPEETPVEETSSEPLIEENITENIPSETVINETQESNETYMPALPNENNQTELINETIEKSKEEPSLIKTILNLIIDKLSFIKGEIINIKAYLSYENETPIPDKQVDFYANNMSIGTETTDDSGLAQIDWDTSSVDPGTYTISADYSGDGVIEGSFDSIEINLSEEVEEVVLNEIISENTTNETQINETLNLTEEINLIINETLNQEINSTLNLTNETLVNQTLINTSSEEFEIELENDFYDYEIDKLITNDGDLLILAEKDLHCIWKPDHLNDGYQICEPVAIIWNKGIKPVNLKMLEDNFEFFAETAIKDNMIEILYSDNYKIYEEEELNKTCYKLSGEHDSCLENRTYIDWKNFESMDGAEIELKPDEFLAVKFILEIPQYQKTYYEVTYKPLNLVLDPDMGGCGTISSPGTYTLTTDINNYDGDCIIIRANDTIFNCNSKTIDGIDGNNYAVNARYSHNVTIQGPCTITDWGSMAIYIRNTNNIGEIKISNMSISSCDSDGIYLKDAPDSNITNVTFDGIGGSGSGVYVSSSPNTYISQLVIHDSYNPGLYISGSNNNMTIHNIEIYNVGDIGMDINGATNSTIYDLDIHNNDLEGIDFASSSNSYIYDFEIYSNDDEGIYIGAGNNNLNLTDGVIHDNSNEGIDLITSNYIYMNNITLYNNSEGLEIDADHCTFSSITIYNNNRREGVILSNAVNNTFTNINSYNNNNSYGDWKDAGSSQNSVENFTSKSANIYFIPYSVKITGLNASQVPADKENYTNISQWINVTNVSASSWLDINFSYNEGDVAPENESNLLVMKYNGSEWISTGFGENPRVDTINNNAGINITDFDGNIFGLFLGPEEVIDNQSKIRNDGTTNASVYLLMKIQYWNGSEWLDEATIHNDALPRRIEPGINNQLKLDAIWNPNAWNTSTNIHGSGTYRVWAAVTDEDEVVLENSSGTSIITTYNFSSSANPLDNSPIVNLIAPADNYNSTTNSITFNCSATDDNQLVNITLYHNISGTWEKNSTVSISGTSNSTTFTLNNISNGHYKWNCLVYDNASQSDWGNSNWTINIIIINDTHKFYIKNIAGENVAWLGSEGNIVLSGNCSNQTSCTPSSDSFIFKDSSDNVVAYINSIGDLCIETGDCSDQSASCNPSNDAFIIQDSSGNNVSYIDITGDLCLTGTLTENGNP
jgi:hypothetical protein